MNYQKIYNNLITKRQNEILPDEIYGEKHHIIPKCLGGNNKKENLVRLTAREHYIAHLLLAKIHNTFGLYLAVIYMQSGRFENRKFKFNSHLYQKIKEELSKKQKGKKHSEESKRKMSEARKGKIPWNKGSKGLQVGWNKGKEFLKGEKNPFYGKHHSEETKRKISEAKKGRIPWNKGKKKAEK